MNENLFLAQEEENYTDLGDVDAFLTEFLLSNEDVHVNRVSFTYTQYDPNNFTGIGMSTTVEKTKYIVEEFE